jgi:asparagine synthase (glutamine-hydrolysing)
MCGISGFIGTGDRATLDRMVATLVHRGPDGAGLWEGEGAFLGMRRLAIIDLATGGQPMFNEDDRLVVVFNGEIYNHVELREELLRAGHRFRSHHSDTEVIVHLYEECGLEFLNRLNGMFAIALWDRRDRRLVLARDRLGIKPLYYAQVGDTIVFGSEPKALLVHPLVGRDPDLAALHHYFSLKNVPAPLSAFIAIRQLGAGDCALWSDGRLETRRWWRIDYAKHQAAVAEHDAAEHIRALLDDSVRLQMRSDVPVGAYLSGGIDSSAVVALMAERGARNLETFTLVYEDGFANKDADRAFARRIADHYGTRHHEHLVTFADVPASIDAVVRAFDEPFSGVISTYFLTKDIARYVKVALSGDGADETFGSYLAPRLAGPLAAYGAGERGPGQLAPFGEQTELLEGILRRGDEAARRMAQYLMDDDAKRALYTAKMRNGVGGVSTEGLIRALYRDSGTADPLNRALFVDMETLLPDQVLSFVDRLSMAHSVEVRPPFLDHRLVEFAAGLPGTVKIKGGRVKHILKEAMRGLLPADLLDRPKEGFVMPINEWLLDRWRGFVESTLSPAQLSRHGLLAPEPVGRMLADHYANRAQHGNRVWNLLMFQLWWNRFQT